MLSEGDPIPDVALTGMDGSPVRPAEFVIFRISQKTATATA